MGASSILVIGGAGYVGSALVPKLLEKGYSVRVFDSFWFWNGKEEYLKALELEENGNLRIFEGDIRNPQEIASTAAGADSAIQLACVSNDPSSDLDEKFTHAVSYDGNVNCIDEAKKAGVERFVYASSSSVYGIKNEPDVTEEAAPEPFTQYSKLKVEIEHYLSHATGRKFRGMSIRPATVCGYAPRLRLDVVVNILTSHAINEGKIRVLGGQQLRPNIHVDDIAELYMKLMDEDIEKFRGQFYNAGWQNLKVMEIAELVKSVVGDVEVEVLPTNDPRSYHICSEKIKRELGFAPQRTVKDAIAGLKKAFEEGRVQDFRDERYYNIKVMKRILGASK